MAGKAAVSLATVRRLFKAFPGVEQGPCYGTPGWRVQGRFLARVREDGETLAIKCGYEERDFRMQADPETFFITDHYRGYPAVLVRLSTVSRRDLADVIEQAWRLNAPRRMVKAFDAEP